MAESGTCRCVCWPGENDRECLRRQTGQCAPHAESEGNACKIGVYCMGDWIVLHAGLGCVVCSMQDQSVLQEASLNTACRIRVYCGGRVYCVRDEGDASDSPLQSQIAMGNGVTTIQKQTSLRRLPCCPLHCPTGPSTAQKGLRTPGSHSTVRPPKSTSCPRTCP